MAIDFNGATDRIDIANARDWAAQAQTFAAWVWLDSADATSEYFFCDHLASDSAFGMIFFRPGGTTGLQHTTVTSGTAQGSATVDSILATGSWIHIAMTWNGLIGTPATDTLFYVGGAVQTNVAGTTGTGTASALTGRHSLGGRVTDDTRNFDGRMAEAARWNRVLTATEIATLASGRRAGEVLRAGLLEYLPLNRRVAGFNPGVTLTRTPIERYQPHPIQIERVVFPSAGSMIAAGVD
jgi:hypothetical protein